MRLFVAINLPEDVRQGIWRAAAPLRELDAPVRWVRPDGIHLTLKFLGEVEPEREAEVRDAMVRAAARAKPFILPVRGFGVFPSRSRPRVVWVGCEAVPTLEILQHDVERALHEIGFPLEMRTFRPHLTLGRAQRGARPPDFRRLGKRLEDVEYVTESPVETVDLMESVLGAQGARYRVRHAAVLTA